MVWGVVDIDCDDEFVAFELSSEGHEQGLLLMIDLSVDWCDTTLLELLARSAGTGIVAPDLDLIDRLDIGIADCLGVELRELRFERLE